jgi:hypothetical protein
MTGIDRVGVVRLPARMTRSHSMGAREFPAVSRSSRYTMILQLPGALPLTSSSGAKPLRVALTRPCWQPSAGVSTSSGKTDDFTAAVARAVAALFIGRPKRRHRIATGRVDRFANDIGPPMCDDGCLQEAADGVRRGHPRRTLGHNGATLDHNGLHGHRCSDERSDFGSWPISGWAWPRLQLGP